MPFWRAIYCAIFGDYGPPGVVVTRTPERVILRLPNQWHDREKWTPALVITTLIGFFVIFSLIAGAVRAPDQTDLPGFLFFIIAAFGVMLGVFCQWRSVWHHEIEITPSELKLRCLSTFKATSTAKVGTPGIRRLTILDRGLRSSLLVELADKSLRVLLPDVDHETAAHVASRIVEERGHIAPALARPDVTMESPFKDAPPNRSDPPLNSTIVLTRHETGVTLDFPLPEDSRIKDRRFAKRSFLWGTSVTAIGLLALWIFDLMGWHDPKGIAAIALFGGGIAIMAAVSAALTAWRDVRPLKDLLQLSVAGNMLIRTTRDHSKEIWYRVEIKDIVIEKIITDEGPNLLQVVMKLHNGPDVILRGPIGDDTVNDYRPKAELEWIATQLKQALHAEPLIADAAPVRESPPSEAIQSLLDSRVMPAER